MNSFCIASIVEGHGEVEAVPILLRRVAAEIDPTCAIAALPPIRVTKSRLLMPGELERAVELAARRTALPGGVLVLLDSDADCPAQLGPSLLRRAARSDVPVGIVLAKQEFEAWFIAAAHSISGKRGLRTDLEAPLDPESIQGAKEWLDERMARGRKYAETLDQPALAALFDLNAARNLPSFNKLWRTVEWLLTSRIGG